MSAAGTTRKLALDSDWLRMARVEEVSEHLRGLSRKNPDVYFSHIRDRKRRPTIVVEVAYCQSQRTLKRAAREYIIGTQGKVNAVIGVKLDYQKSNRAWIWLWRPRITLADDGVEVVGVMT